MSKQTPSAKQLAAKQLAAKKKKANEIGNVPQQTAAPAVAPAPQTPAEVAAALAKLGVVALPAGAPSRGGSRGRAEFDPATHDIAGIVVPTNLAARKMIDAMHSVLLANPDKFVSRSQLAAVCIKAGLTARNGAEGVRHTATCQTGNQGTQETGYVFSVGNASDGEKGYKIDKRASELVVVGQVKAGTGWDGQSKAVRRRGSDGFPWPLETAEARAAGFRGTNG